MGDNLQDKPRKELKELCSQNNIRTAGVKHEDLVRLLRNKLYPSAPSTPRSPKARGAKAQSSVKDNGDSYKTPVKMASKGRSVRTLSHEMTQTQSATLPAVYEAANCHVDQWGPATFDFSEYGDTHATNWKNESPQEVTSFRRKNSGLSRKPLLTKSNTFSSRKADSRSKVPGVDQDAQENAILHHSSVRRLCHVNGQSPLSRKSAVAPGQLETTSMESSVQSGGENKDVSRVQTDSNAQTEDMASPRVSEGDAGSDGSRRVSEVATDAGPDTLSDFSDADEFRSVSSEPMSRFSSLGKRLSLRSESSKLSFCSAQSGLSFFTAGSWGSDNSRSMDNLLASVECRGDVTEDIFPEFPEGSDFLVGDADALELSFLDAGAADPEMLVIGKDHELKVDRFNAMDSPMARDYVNYNRGSETEVSKNCASPSGVPLAELASDEGNTLRDVNMADRDAADTSVKIADKQEFTTVAPTDDAASQELGLIEGDFEIRANRSSHTHDDFIREDVSSDGSLPIEVKSAVISSEIASGMEPSDMDGGEVDTPIQHGSCSREDGQVISKDIEDYAEVHGQTNEGDDSAESGSPTIESSVAKKLEFEPVQTTQLAPLPQTEHNDEDKEVDGRSNFQTLEGPAPGVRDTVEASASHSHVSNLDEPTVDSEHGSKVEVVSMSAPPTMQNASSDVDHGEYNSEHQTVEQDTARNSNHEDAETSSRNVESSESEDHVTSKEGVLAEKLDSSSNDTCVNGKDYTTASIAEDFKRHSNADTDTSLVTPVSASHLDSSTTKSTAGNTAPELDRLANSGCPANDQEGSDVKMRDGECASPFGPVHDSNKDRRVKEDMQLKLSFPFSVVLWCSQSCSPMFGNRSQRLGS